MSVRDVFTATFAVYMEQAVWAAVGHLHLYITKFSGKDTAGASVAGQVLAAPSLHSSCPRLRHWPAACEPPQTPSGDLFLALVMLLSQRHAQNKFPKLMHLSPQTFKDGREGGESMRLGEEGKWGRVGRGRERILKQKKGSPPLTPFSVVEMLSPEVMLYLPTQ